LEGRGDRDVTLWSRIWVARTNPEELREHPEYDPSSGLNLMCESPRTKLFTLFYFNYNRSLNLVVRTLNLVVSFHNFSVIFRFLNEISSFIALFRSTGFLLKFAFTCQYF